MGFKLRSGNTTNFKSMGSSPAKQGERFDPNDPKQMEALKKIPKSVDPDAPGTPGKPGFEPPVTSMDYLTKIPVGPRATKKPLDREKWEEENRIEHNVEAKMDEYPPKYFHMDLKSSKNKKK